MGEEIKMNLKAFSLLLAVAFLANLGAAPSLYGQGSVSGGSVVGAVTDSSGAAVPNAEVTLTDVGTKVARTTKSNGAGLYAFREVPVGTYNLKVSTSGFRTLEIARVEVTVGGTLTLNAKLEVGAISEVVEVKAQPGAELQTLDATMGATIGGKDMLNLPTIARDASSLIYLQATAAPTFNGALSNIYSGQVAGAFSDQNSVQLDGGNNSSTLDGDNATYVGLRGGAMQMPVESVEEFRVNTNNMTADFGSSGGAQVIVSTKRGTNQFHGSGYDFFQANWLNSNDWSNNFNGIAKPKQHYNRFGGALGGPMLPAMLGGKTYFYMNFEGERYPRSGPLTKTVPSDALRAGIITIRDASGTPIQYNLKTAMVCGAAGNSPCDPRLAGMSPVVSKIWSYEPEPNLFTSGDRLNTFGYQSNLSYPLTNNFGVVRIDHDFGDKNRFFASYRIFSQDNPTTNQVDIGGVLPGDTKGQPAPASITVDQPRYVVLGLNTSVTPSITNDLHFNYLRDQWQWLRAGANPYIPGVPAGVTIGGDSSGALVPLNIDTQNSRPRLWNSHNFDFRDGVSWLKGNHLIQVGGDFLHQWFHFDRYDNVTGGLTQDKYLIQSSGISFSSAFQPVVCTTALTHNCIPSSQLGTYNGFYADILGMVAQNNIVATRTGSNLTLNPLGSPVASYSHVENYSVYFNDAWKISPHVTINYGLNYNIQMPPYELNGAQDTLVDQNGVPITTAQFLQARQSAALLGQNYNPTLGFSPVGAVGLKYPYATDYRQLAPRVSVAWNPSSSGDSWFSKLLGNNATVIRAGYGRFYTKSLGIDLVSDPVLGDGFLQTVSCADPTSAGACTKSSGTTPASAFRLGVDGNTVPLPAIPQTLATPVRPGVNAAYETFASYLDSGWKPGSSDQITFSIQRQLKGNTILEVGYVGVFARNLFQGIDLNDVPYMMTLGGQSFQAAYAAVSKQLLPTSQGGAGVVLGSKTVLPAQPFFESALKGSSYCTGYANCTTAVAQQEQSYITTQDVTSMVSDLDGAWLFGPMLPSSTQTELNYGATSMGFSNYNALTVTLKKRMSNMTLNSNFTYAKAMGTIGINQAYTENNANDPWDLRKDYGPQFFDHKFVFNLLGTYTLPFGKGQHWKTNNGIGDRIIGGWSVSPIFTIASGLPLSIYSGYTSASGDQRGNGYVTNGCTAVPMSSMSYSNGPVFGVKSDGNVGVNGDSNNGGSGVNMFSNPTAVYNNFRPYILGVDGNCGGGGILRGQLRWNVDLGITKDTAITERVGFQIYGQIFNLFNHMMWGDPYLDLQDPADFGVLGGQFNALPLSGAGASANFTRVIQLGLRIHF